MKAKKASTSSTNTSIPSPENERQETRTVVPSNDGRYWMTVALSLFALLSGFWVRLEGKAERSQFDNIEKELRDLRVTVSEYTTTVRGHEKELDRLGARIGRLESLSLPISTRGGGNGARR